MEKKIIELIIHYGQKLDVPNRLEAKIYKDIVTKLLKIIKYDKCDHILYLVKTETNGNWLFCHRCPERFCINNEDQLFLDDLKNMNDDNPFTLEWIKNWLRINVFENKDEKWAKGHYMLTAEHIYNLIHDKYIGL